MQGLSLSVRTQKLQQRALDWANAVRAQHGLPPVPRLERGMPTRPAECALARTIAPGNALVERDGAVVLGRHHEVPRFVRRFIHRFDWYHYPKLVTVRPMGRRASIDDLDYAASPLQDEEAVTPAAV